jgi:hypothetical protein
VAERLSALPRGGGGAKPRPTLARVRPRRIAIEPVRVRATGVAIEAMAAAPFSAPSERSASHPDRAPRDAMRSAPPRGWTMRWFGARPGSTRRRCLASAADGSDPRAARVATTGRFCSAPAGDCPVVVRHEAVRGRPHAEIAAQRAQVTRLSAETHRPAHRRGSDRDRGPTTALWTIAFW